MSHHEHGCCRPAGSISDRRRFLTLAALGAGVSLLTPIAPRPAEAGQADALLLSCMDYRLLDEIVAYMNGRGMRDKYDHVILAGAGLGALTDKRPDWGAAFWQHVDVAKQLHHIHKLIVMDHRDCGAYREFLGVDYGKDPKAETEIHTKYLRAFAVAAKERHPELEVELLLMSLDGKVEEVAPA